MPGVPRGGHPYAGRHRWNPWIERRHVWHMIPYPRHSPRGLSGHLPRHAFNDSYAAPYPAGRSFFRTQGL
jgi:hypothetical protein